MKLPLSILLAVVVSSEALAGACCGGEGPRSFLQLRELQTYQLGLSTSLKDVYGRFDEYGDLVKADTRQTYTVSAGAAARVAEDLDVQLIVPWVHQLERHGGKSSSAGNLGDVSVGARYALVRALFHDDWYPTIFVSGGVKAPTGTVEALSSDGRITPGSGNGIWEPYLGLSVQKPVGSFTLGVSATYTGRMKRTVATQTLNEGDRVSLSEWAAVALSERWSWTIGSGQNWDMARRIDGVVLADTSSRFATASLSTTFFLTRYWAMTVEGEASLPAAKFGVNQSATRSLTLTTSYAFY